MSYIHGLKLIVSDYGWYLYNAHGDVTALANASGTVTRNYDYDPFGVQRSKVDAADNNPYRYCGEYYDTESGYTYLRARYYDPSIGRFISEDPALDGYNWYVYCNGNPVNYWDPTGLWVLSAGIEGGAAAILGMYLAVGMNYNGRYLSLTVSVGALIITNISAYGAGYVAYYPTKKSVDDVRGWGASAGISFSMGVHLGAGGGFEAQADNSHGFSGSVGIGCSYVPIPYFQVKFGYTWTLYKWDLSKTKNGTSQTKSVWGISGSSIRLTKHPTYTDAYVPKLKRTIRMYTGTKSGVRVW